MMFNSKGPIVQIGLGNGLAQNRWRTINLIND